MNSENKRNNSESLFSATILFLSMLNDSNIPMELGGHVILPFQFLNGESLTLNYLL